MAISRNQNVVDGGLGQPSAGVRSFLALFGSEHRAGFIVKFANEQISFARGFGSANLIVYDDAGFQLCSRTVGCTT